MPLQLPLPFVHQPSYDPRDFIAASSNHDALAWLDATWPDQRLALFGPPGCGKSHLLHVWQRRTGAVLLTGPALTDLALTDLALTDPDVVPLTGALALDEADFVTQETLLLHLLNTARDRGLRVLLAARTAPARWPVRLPDLSSRLRAITAVEIKSPDDELLAALLKHLVADRQLTMTQAAHDWLLLHLPRSPAALREAVARLDQESLASGVAITRPFAAKLLQEGEISASEIDEDSDIDEDSMSDHSDPVWDPGQTA